MTIAETLLSKYISSSEFNQIYRDLMHNWRLELTEDGGRKYYIGDCLVCVDPPAPLDENVSLIDCLLSKDGDVK